MMIRTREQLIGYVAKHSTDVVVKRSIEEGRPIELLGAFSPVPGSSNPGWILKLSTRFNRTIIIIVAHHHTGKDNVYTVNEVDFKHYIGGAHPLYGGDNPAHCEYLRGKKYVWAI